MLINEHLLLSQMKDQLRSQSYCRLPLFTTGFQNGVVAQPSTSNAFITASATAGKVVGNQLKDLRKFWKPKLTK